MTQNKGVLYLIPTNISDDNFNVIPNYTLSIIETINIFIVEEIKSARKFIKKISNKNINEIIFTVYNEHNKITDENYLEPCLKGQNIGLLSESGTPCIADPGKDIVLQAHQLNIKVVPLVGPSSIIMALMSSGLNGQNFAFVGYLPIKKNLRQKRIKELEYLSYKLNQTQIFIETPYRNQQLFDDILATCKENTLLSIASEITSKDEYISTKTIKNWKKNYIKIDKKNTIFILMS